MANPAQRYLSFLFFTVLIIVPSLFVTKSASAEWSFDSQAPMVKITFICAGGLRISQTVSGGSQVAFSTGNPAATCQPTNNYFQLEIECRDVNQCTELNYDIVKCFASDCSGANYFPFVNQNIIIAPGSSTFGSNPDNGGNWDWSFIHRYNDPQGIFASGAVEFRISVNRALDTPGNIQQKIAPALFCDVRTDPNCAPGVKMTGDIHGSVFIDTNRNGAFDVGEQRYTGLQVQLSGGPTSQPPATTSNIDWDNDGVTDINYRFSYLQDGNYTVTIILPAGFTATTTNPVNNITTPPYQNVNFGIAPSHNITGRIYSDINNNGLIDAGDPLFQDLSSPAQVTLSGSANGQGISPSDPPMPDSRTTTNGTYSFLNRPNGSYTASLTTPTNYKSVIAFPKDQFGNQTTQPFNLTTATTVQNRTVDFLVQGFVISGGAPNGGLYLDYDDSGTLVIPPDTRFVAPNGFSTPINLKDVNGNIISTLNSSAIDASFAFTFLRAGTYYVEPPLPNGYKGIKALDFPDVNPARSRVVIVNSDINNLRFLVSGWTILGRVKIDYNHNAAIDLPEDEYKNGIAVALGGGYNARPAVITYTSPPTEPAPNANLVGFYKFTGLRGGLTGYSVDIDPSTPGYTSKYPNNPPSDQSPRSNLQLGCAIPSTCEPTNINFSITPLYSISGHIFIDQNKDLIKGGDPDYTSTPLTIEVIAGPGMGTLMNVPRVINTNTGLYDTFDPTNPQTTGLISGRYTIRHTTLPDGFELSYPVNGPPQSFDVWIGTERNSIGVAIPPPNGYRCVDTFGPPPLHNNAECWQPPGTPFVGSIRNTNFGITDSIPWFQAQGGDVRNDRGITNPIPDVSPPSLFGNIVTDSSTAPGIWFSGNNSPDFCASQFNRCEDRSSEKKWIVGSTIDGDPEFSPKINGALSTEYNTLLNKATTNSITPIGLNTVPGCTNPAAGCTLPSSAAQLPNGIYQHTGDVQLNASTLPLNGDYIFLIDGDLTISGNVIVPVGTTATFSTRQDIHISSSVGQTPNLLGSGTNCSITNPGTPGETHTGCNVEGIYSANRHFVIEGSGRFGCQGIPGTPRDSRVNIAGVIIANALFSTSGGLANNRDTCEDNLLFPTYTIKDRPDIILNVPEFLKYKSYTWQEVAP